MKNLIKVYKDLKAKKNEEYYSHARYDLLPYVTIIPKRILDVGCGRGLTGELMKRHFKAEFAAGVEMDIAAAKEASGRLDKVVVIDLNRDKLVWEGEKFDLIILGDVLEHLAEPQKLLTVLKGIIEKEGIIVLSVPNARNWRMISMLLFKGDWKYEKSGLMDKTHLRFYTLKSVKRLFIEFGFKPVKTGGRKRICDAILNALTLNLISGIFINQLYITFSLEDSKCEVLS